MMRTLRRLVAHNRMKKDGYSQINKDNGTGSFFSKNWREFVSKNYKSK